MSVVFSAHDPSQERQREEQMRVLQVRSGALIGAFLAAGLAVSVAAGLLEDGLSAYERGDFAAALTLLRPLADHGDANAQVQVGIMYRTGRGVARDPAEAARWLRKAADQGLARAQSGLANMYEFGQGVAQDYGEAAKWYLKAADQGIATAQYRLADMHKLGRGVAQDYVEAAKWFQKAADQGFAHAQFDLGVMYEKGQGVAQNYVQAYKWLDLAAARFPAAEPVLRPAAISLRDGAAAAKMTPAQLEEARRMAREWKPK
jgi:TPR repeat protein